MAENVADQIRDLLEQARNLGNGHTKDLAVAMADTSDLAAEIAHGGAAYPAGVREVARQVAESLASQLLTLEAILAKSA